jgi:hypothetical protein
VIASCGGSPGATLDGGPGATLDGDPGETLDGSPPDAPPWCDDHSACTDDRVEGGACRFDPVEDGRPCDDGDLCTLGDRCQAGRCVGGGRAQGALARLGTLDSLAGGGIGVLGERFLAVTGRSWAAHLRVAERQGADLTVVASWDGALGFSPGSDILVQALDGGLVALARRQDRSIALFSLFSLSGEAPPALARRADAMLDGQILSLASRGHRLWVCTRDFFRGSEVALIDVSDPDAPSVIGSISMPSDCGSIDTSDDGARVYVNTPDGVRFVDASPLDTGGYPRCSHRPPESAPAPASWSCERPVLRASCARAISPSWSRSRSAACKPHRSSAAGSC